MTSNRADRGLASPAVTSLALASDVTEEALAARPLILTSDR